MLGGKMHNQGGINRSIHLKDIFKSSAYLVSTEPEPDLWVESCSRNPEETRSGSAYFAVFPVKSIAVPKLPLNSSILAEPVLDEVSESDSDDFTPIPQNTWNDHELYQSINKAIELGCKVVIADRPLRGLSVPLLVVSNPAEAFGVCCHALKDNPGQSLTLIGITGTYGKTSTSYLAAGMLAESGNPVGLIGTLGIYDGEKMFPSTEASLPPDELAYWLSRMVANGCSHAIMEISSQAIAQSDLAGIKFDAICLTNIRRNHIDFHKTVEAYRRTKLSVFQYLKKKGIAICNADDLVTSAVLPLIDHPVLTVGMRNHSEVSGMVLERGIGEQTFLITAGTEVVPLSTKMVGEEHLFNCLTTAALGIGLGIDLRISVRGIERVTSVPGRMEQIDCGQPFSVFVDCAPTPESLAGSLKSLRKIVLGKIYCVFGLDEQTDRERSDLIGRTLRTFADVSILTAGELQSPYGKIQPESVSEILKETDFKIPTKQGNIRVIETRPEAIAWALSNAEPEDCVLVVGRGCSDFQRFIEAEEGNLCDRNYVKHWLYENQPCLSFI